MKRNNSKGFTLVEIIIVVVILGIAAVLAVPTLSNAADIQVRSAANRIAADLDYAKNLAITHQRTYSIVFNPSGEAYEIQDESGSPVSNPLTGNDFVVDFSTDNRLNRVDLVSADFDSDSSNTMTFDYLGSPYSGTDTTAPLNSGTITLGAAGFTLYVKVEPVTGYVMVEETP